MPLFTICNKSQLFRTEWMSLLSFNPMAEFVHIWPKDGLKQPSIFLVYTLMYS